MLEVFQSIISYLEGNERCICITGSGGKTTALIGLAKAYAELGRKVLVSTTTKLEPPEARDYGCTHYFDDVEAVLHHTSKASEQVFFALKGDKKALAPPLSVLSRLLDSYDVLLLEADGAGQKGLKLHTDRDPVVPAFTTATLAVLSFSLFGRSLKDVCFGAEQLADTSVDLETYAMLLSHKEGVMKRMKGKSLILCNQAEHSSESMRKALLSCFPTLPIWFCSLSSNLLIQRNMQ